MGEHRVKPGIAEPGVKTKAIVCTIVTKSHFAYARTLMRSLERHNSGYECYALIVDDLFNYIQPEKEPFHIISLVDLALPFEKALCFQYSAFELCNASKPFLLRYLRSRFPEQPLLYLDSDIYVLGCLDSVLADVMRSSVMLTPHTFTDYPPNCAFHETAMLLSFGVYNAGVIGIGQDPGAGEFLTWWAAKLTHHCIDDRSRGFYVDQKFLDCVPALFDGVTICRHPGVNVGHFNIHERKIHRTEATWKVAETDLLLFHATQIDWESRRFRIIELNRHLDNTDLQNLIDCYVQELTECGWKDSRNWPYSFSGFEDGTPILHETRRAFREAVYHENISSVDPFTDPKWRAFQDGFQRETRDAARTDSILRRIRPWANRASRALGALKEGRMHSF